MVTFKGQMVMTRLQGDGAVLFMGSPRCANLDDLQVRLMVPSLDGSCPFVMWHCNCCCFRGYR